MPKPHAWGDVDRVYQNLLGTLDTRNTTVWAECVFADPVADIAVLGPVDNQELFHEAAAYDAFVENAPVLRIGNARSGIGWILALDGQWIPTTLEVFSNICGVSLWIGPTEAGMSGSPILNHAGRAVGVVVVGTERVSKSGERTNEWTGPQAILAHALPHGSRLNKTVSFRTSALQVRNL